MSLENSAITRTADQLYEIFATRDRLSSALIALSLMDYVEETLQLVWGDDNVTPGLVYDFAAGCIDLQLS